MSGERNVPVPGGQITAEFYNYTITFLFTTVTALILHEPDAPKPGVTQA